MRFVLEFLSHRFTIRQSVLIIGASLLVAFIANEASEAAGLPRTAVTCIGLAAAVATFAPLMAVFYRRTRT